MPDSNNFSHNTVSPNTDYTYLDAIFGDKMAFSASAVSALTGAGCLVKGIMFTATAPQTSIAFIVGGVILTTGGIYYGTGPALRIAGRSLYSVATSTTGYLFDNLKELTHQGLTAGKDFAISAKNTTYDFLDKSKAFLEPRIGSWFDSLPSKNTVIETANDLGIKTGEIIHQYGQKGYDYVDAQLGHLDIPSYSPPQTPFTPPPYNPYSQIDSHTPPPLYGTGDSSAIPTNFNGFSYSNYEYRGLLNLGYLSVAGLLLLSGTKSLFSSNNSTEDNSHDYRYNGPNGAESIKKRLKEKQFERAPLTTLFEQSLNRRTDKWYEMDTQSYGNDAGCLYDDLSSTRYYY